MVMMCSCSKRGKAMTEEIAYYQQPNMCGKPSCRKCREGVGHGPYWYEYRKDAHGRITRKYIGKHLPEEKKPGKVLDLAPSLQLPLRLSVLGPLRLWRVGEQSE